jgi:outer membrane protein assembly factor BamB
VQIENENLYVGSIGGSLVGLNKSDGSRLWTDVILGASEKEVAVYGSPVVADGLIYVAGYNGKVYAISADTGALSWVYPREGNLETIVGGVVVSQGYVYFGSSDGKVYALDAVTGERAWLPFETGNKIWSTPTVSEDTVYVTSFDKKLYALDANTGSEKWVFAEAGGAILSTPLIYDNTVYFGSFDRYIYAVDATNGSLKWRSEVESGKWFWAKPVVYNNVIYAPCLDAKVYILDAESGREVASAVELDSSISSGPVIVEDKVIVASQEGQVYSLDTGNNLANLLFPDIGDEGEKIYAPLSASDGTVYIHAQTTKKDTLYAVIVKTGGEVWRPVALSTK